MNTNRLLPSLLGLLVVTLTIPSAWAQYRRECDRVPVLFQDSNFRGRSFPIDGHLNNLHDRGFGDEASSVCVPAGWRVVLYEDSNFRGDRFELTGPDSISDLKRDGRAGRNWGDRVSSIEAFRIRRRSNDAPAECDRYPMLFKNKDFRGRSIRLDQDQRNLRNLGFGDSASSACVPVGWRVEFFEDSNFRGDRLRLDNGDAIADLKRDRPQGHNWGDRISSARIISRDAHDDRNGYGTPGRRPERYPDQADREATTSGATSSCNRVPVLFQNAGFGGRRLNLTASITDLSRSRFGNQASSVCVPLGWMVTLYDGINYRGRSLRLRGGDRLDNLARNGWNDRVLSVRVQAPRRRR